MVVAGCNGTSWTMFGFDATHSGDNAQEQAIGAANAGTLVKAGSTAAVDGPITSAPTTANDILYAMDASRDYDPAPALERITAPLLAVNSADDLVNPPELKILERAIARVPHGRAIVIPYSERTHGHGSHSVASLWKDELLELLRTSER